jgi:hypothetical protein
MQPRTDHYNGESNPTPNSLATKGLGGIFVEQVDSPVVDQRVSTMFDD